MKTKEILMIHCLALLGIALIASLFKKVPGIVKNGSFFIAIVLLAVSQVLDETNEPLIPTPSPRDRHCKHHVNKDSYCMTWKTTPVCHGVGAIPCPTQTPAPSDTNDPVLYTKDKAQHFTGAYNDNYQPFYNGTDKKDSPGYGLRNDGGYCYPSTQSAMGDGNYNANPFLGPRAWCGETDIFKIKNNNPTWDDKNKEWLRGGQPIPRPEGNNPANPIGKTHLNWDKICMTPCCRSQIAYCCQQSGNFTTCITDRGCNVDINGKAFTTEEIEKIENNCSSAHN